MTLLEVAPAAVAVLTKPLDWLTEGLHPCPRESLGNLIVAFPPMFMYWGCVGTLVALLTRAAFRVFLKPNRTGPDNLKPPGSP